jgi:hypothetical protein
MMSGLGIKKHPPPPGCPFGFGHYYLYDCNSDIKQHLYHDYNQHSSIHHQQQQQEEAPWPPPNNPNVCFPPPPPPLCPHHLQCAPDHLTYWRGFPGRGEFIRLALEAGGASYVDTPGGNDEVVELIKPTFDAGPNPPPLAPPVLRCGDLLLAQTANILLFLGPRLRLVPEEERGRLHVNQLALTALDLSDEAHNTQ